MYLSNERSSRVALARVDSILASADHSGRVWWRWWWWILRRILQILQISQIIVAESGDSGEEEEEDDDNGDDGDMVSDDGDGDIDGDSQFSEILQ